MPHGSSNLCGAPIIATGIVATRHAHANTFRSAHLEIGASGICSGFSPRLDILRPLRYSTENCRRFYGSQRRGIVNLSERCQFQPQHQALGAARVSSFGSCSQSPAWEHIVREAPLRIRLQNPLSLAASRMKRSFAVVRSEAELRDEEPTVNSNRPHPARSSPPSPASGRGKTIAPSPSFTAAARSTARANSRTTFPRRARRRPSRSCSRRRRARRGGRDCGR